MPTQNRTWQKKLLAGARSVGEIDKLYWYIEVDAPGGRSHLAGYPGRWVPVVPVGNDPEASRRIAGLVAEFFRLSNDPRLSYTECLMDAQQLADYRWYIWTESVPVDAVCVDCAGVETVLHTELECVAGWICGACRRNKNDEGKYER